MAAMLSRLGGRGFQVGEEPAGYGGREGGCDCDTDCDTDTDTDFDFDLDEGKSRPADALEIRFAPPSAPDARPA
ncbi:MAG: hypothetical protein MUE73_01555 [Planctomycetes bacterium]|nr:hypothetical protein [Planctomycetota bacterium]